MQKLHIYQPSEQDDLAWPEADKNFTLNTPAIEFFSDFMQSEPLVIEGATSASEAKLFFLKEHVNMKLVIDDDRHFIGVISLKELDDQEIIRRASEGFKREDILVSDLMKPKHELMALDIHEVTSATVNDIIQALKENSKEYCLFIDHNTHKIRGIVSAEGIARKLHIPINIQDRPEFYKAFSAVS